MEAGKLALVYVHLIACCVALGAILSSDLSMMWRVLQGRAGEPDAHMQRLARVVSIALLMLWATGLYFVWHESAAGSLARTLSNPKLQAKIIVVSILTLNGVVLHYGVLPMLSRMGSLLNLNARQRALAVWAGALSGVSWMYAAFLGIARPLAWKYPLEQILLAYPFLVAAAFAAVWGLTSWAVRQGGTPYGSMAAKR